MRREHRGRSAAGTAQSPGGRLCGEWGSMIFSCPSSPPGVCLTGRPGSTGRRGCSNAGLRARWRAWRERCCLKQSCNQSITSSHNSCTPKAGMCYKIFKSSVVCKMRLCIHSKCSFSAVRVKVPTWRFLSVCLDSCWLYQQFMLG